jgi:hypothetical protein
VLWLKRDRLSFRNDKSQYAITTFYLGFIEEMWGLISDTHKSGHDWELYLKYALFSKLNSLHKKKKKKRGEIRICAENVPISKLIVNSFWFRNNEFLIIFWRNSLGILLSNLLSTFFVDRGAIPTTCHGITVFTFFVPFKSSVIQNKCLN